MRSNDELPLSLRRAFYEQLTNVTVHNAQRRRKRRDCVTFFCAASFFRVFVQKRQIIYNKRHHQSTESVVCPCLLCVRNIDGRLRRSRYYCDNWPGRRDTGDGTIEPRAGKVHSVPPLVKQTRPNSYRVTFPSILQYSRSPIFPISRRVSKSIESVAFWNWPREQTPTREPVSRFSNEKLSCCLTCVGSTREPETITTHSNANGPNIVCRFCALGS